ncbi:MAG: DUF4329 domain-containing protein [Alphaproteobacteria bacterium]|nr:MAG: DUF4329 domain-containing protein [Alphaproteobacteria bacterium]
MTFFLSLGREPMPPAARITDMHVCPMFTGPVPHVGGPIMLGCFPVLTQCLPQARVTDMAVCVGPPDMIAMGAPTVLVGGLPAARMGDPTAHGGTIALGCFTVLIPGGGGGGGGGGSGTGAGGAAGAPVAGGPSAQSFATQEEAAKAALDAANPQSIADNREYGGLVYRNPDGTYGYTNPSGGTGTGFNPHAISAPPGATVVGDYHTHGDYSVVGPNGPVRTSDPAQDSYNSDNFSSADINGINADAAGNPEYRGYLGTPSGKYLEYNPTTGTTHQIN